MRLHTSIPLPFLATYWFIGACAVVSGALVEFIATMAMHLTGPGEVGAALVWGASVTVWMFVVMVCCIRLPLQAALRMDAADGQCGGGNRT